MRSMTRSLLIAIAALSLGWSVLSVLYTKNVSDELRELRREKASDVIYLTARIRDLQQHVSDSLLGRPAVTLPSDSEAQTPATEEITLPTHESPEVKPTDPASYMLAEHNGQIGVFDGEGELIRTLDVFVMTLPEADREALSDGIPAASWQELCELIECYE